MPTKIVAASAIARRSPMNLRVMLIPFSLVRGLNGAQP
jgi:hypothetical protein